MTSQQAIRALLIINPNSRQGVEAALEQGLDQLSESGFQVEQLLSSSPEESRKAVKARRDRLDLVILGGGDGTISSMAETLHDCQLPLAVLPLGTANDLARSLGVADNLETAFSAIVANRRKRIDLGCVNGHYFFNVAHIGLGVKVTEELSDEVKRRLGVFSYLKALFSAMSRSDQFRVSLQLDEHDCRLRSMHLAIGNGRYYGGGNILSEDAQIDDGMLSLYNLAPQKLWELLLLAPLLRSGRQRENRRIFTAQARKVTLRTSRRLAIHADGEPVSHTPATFEVLPGALEAIAHASGEDPQQPGADS